jgi:DNA adenine methylase
MRESKPTRPTTRAARFLYLNRTAFGGIYRVNLRGQFNVPFGGGERTPALLWKTDALQLASKTLRSARLKVSDFESIIDAAGSGDVVYCDPTYTVAHDNNGFVRYNERNFTWEDQIRLAKAAFRAAKRGSTVLVSNANHDSVRELYRGAHIEVLNRISTVTPLPAKRRPVEELLICINPVDQSR